MRWITEDDVTSGTVSELNMIGSLKVDRDNSRAGWKPIKSGTSTITVDVPEAVTESNALVVNGGGGNTKIGDGNTKSFTINLGVEDDLSSDPLRIIDVRYKSVDVRHERRVPAPQGWLPWNDDNTWENAKDVFTITASSDFSDFTGENGNSGDMKITAASSDTYASGIDRSVTVSLKNQHSDKVRIKKFLIRAEVDYERIAETVTVQVPEAISREIEKVLRSGDDAKKLETAFERRAEESVFHYTFKSQDEFAVGDQLQLTSSELNIDTNVVVLDRTFSYVNDVLIWEYECEGSAELSDIVGLVSDPIVVAPPPSRQVVDRIARKVDEAIDEDGFLQRAVSSSAIKGPIADDGVTQLPFIPTETALYMTDQFIGFFNADDDTVGWVAYMQNDGGVGKMRVGDDDHNMEWDGSELFVRGAATIDGTITAGDGIESADYDAGVDGWQISGDGNAEFNDVTVRGTVEADAGAIGGWDILTNRIQSDDTTVRVDSNERRFEVQDVVGTPKTALGYLGNLPGFTSDEFGLFVADGNTVSFSSGGTFEEGSYFINADAAFVSTSGDTEVVRLGSLGGGEIGLDIGGMTLGDTLGGGGATGTFDPVIGGGGATGTFSGVTLGGGNALYGNKKGLLYRLSDNTLAFQGELKAATGTFSGELTADAAVLGGAIVDESITAAKIDVADLFSEDITFSGTFQSSDYSAGSEGVKLDPTTGTYEFNGEINATSGSFSGTMSGGTIEGTDIIGGTIDINDGDFEVSADGSISSLNISSFINVGNSTIRGVTGIKSSTSEDDVYEDFFDYFDEPSGVIINSGVIGWYGDEAVTRVRIDTFNAAKNVAFYDASNNFIVDFLDGTTTAISENFRIVMLQH